MRVYENVFKKFRILEILSVIKQLTSIRKLICKITSAVFLLTLDRIIYFFYHLTHEKKNYSNNFLLIDGIHISNSQIAIIGCI